MTLLTTQLLQLGSVPFLGIGEKVSSTCWLYVSDISKSATPPRC